MRQFNLGQLRIAETCVCPNSPVFDIIYILCANRNLHFLYLIWENLETMGYFLDRYQFILPWYTIKLLCQIFTHYVNIPVWFIALFHGSVNSIFKIKICGTFLIYGPKTYCGCLWESPHWGGSNKYPRYLVWAKARKIMHTPVNYPFSHTYMWGLHGFSLHGNVNIMRDWPEVFFKNLFGQSQKVFFLRSHWVQKWRKIRT